MKYNTKYGDIEIYAKTIEQEAVSQILEMANSPLGENAHIRIMPDCHAGAGCVIGTTMLITDKVCPNLVGVDIGCGVDLVKTNIDFENNLEKLDEIIRRYIPFGMETHSTEKEWNFEDLYCWQYLDLQTKSRAKTALGTLGGGNHFIEAYKDGWLSVHSGSRNIGYKVAEYYQKLAEKRIKEHNSNLLKEKIKTIEQAVYQKKQFEGVGTPLFNKSPTSNEKKLAQKCLDYYTKWPAKKALFFKNPGNNVSCPKTFFGPLIGRYKRHCFFGPEGDASKCKI